MFGLNRLFPQRKPCLRFLLSLKQRPLEHLDRDFTGKDDGSGRQVAAEGIPFLVGQTDVPVDHRLAVFDGDIPHETDNFQMPVELQRFVLLFVLVVVHDCCLLNRPDGLDPTQGDLFFDTDLVQRLKEIGAVREASHVNGSGLNVS